MATNGLIKDLSDADLDTAIADYRAAAASWSDLGSIVGAFGGFAGKGGRSKSKAVAKSVFDNLRLLDIAVAVKRSRIKAGTWTGKAVS